MPTEIERKFLLADVPTLPDDGQPIQQVYVAKGAAAVRVRISRERAWLTLKGVVALDAQGRARGEWEYEVPLADACEMARLPGAYGLEKTRYRIAHSGRVFELDAYEGALQGRFTVEVEVDALDSLVDLPTWVGQEVTGQEQYSNEKLALNGWPVAG